MAWRMALACALLAGTATPIFAQPRPESGDLTQLPPVPTSFTPERLPWGDYDFTGIWPTERLTEGRILFQRPPAYGDRAWVTDEEFERRLAAARGNDGSYAAATETGIGTAGTAGLEHWFRTADMGKRTSVLVDPPDGQLLRLTPEGQRLFDEGRSGWKPGQHYDWVTDLDTWDRCITRGFPASMYPNRYNNGIRLFQSPGYIVIMLEMLGTRVIPIVSREQATQHWPDNVTTWMGNSRAWWDGKTLVIETRNIMAGDAVTQNSYRRSAAPVIVTMIGGAPFNTIPTSPAARSTERLTMTGPDAIVHELTYSDLQTFTAPWTARIEWTRDESHQFFEYACHEANHMPRDYISASRGQRAKEASGEVPPVTAAEDDRARFTQQFDWDPGLGPRPAPAGQ